MFEIANWEIKFSHETDDPNIKLVEFNNKGKQWFARVDMDQRIILDAMPTDCTAPPLLSEAVMFYITIAI